MVRGFYFCCEFLHTAVQAWFTLKLAGSVWEPKREARTQYVVWAVAALAVAGLNTYNDSVISVLFSRTFMIMMILLLSWMNKVLYQCKYQASFCLTFILWSLLTLVDFFFQTLAYMVLDSLNFQRDILLSANVPRAVYQLLWVAFFLWAKKFVCQWVRQKRWEMEGWLKRGWILMLPLYLCMIYFQRIYVPVFSVNLLYDWWLFLLAVLLIGVIFLACMLVQRERERSRIMQIRMDILGKEYQISQRADEEMEILRHDFRKHLKAVWEMAAEAGVSHEVLDYLEEMSGMTMQRGRNRNFANHDLLNVVLNMKYREAEVFGISVQYEADDMSGLLLEPMEIVAVFSNLLDNAIEANQALEEGVKRWISLSCIRKGQMMIISASNAKAGEELKFEGGIPRTTKRDKKSHGLGLRSIRQVVEQHDGHMQIDVEEDTFSLVVYLKGFK